MTARILLDLTQPLHSKPGRNKSCCHPGQNRQTGLGQLLHSQYLAVSDGSANAHIAGDHFPDYVHCGRVIGDVNGIGAAATGTTSGCSSSNGNGLHTDNNVVFDYLLSACRTGHSACGWAW